MAADLEALLAAAVRVLDDRHAIAAHGGPDPMQRDADLLATFVRDLLTQKPTSRVERVGPAIFVDEATIWPTEAPRLAASILRAAEAARAPEGTL